MEKNTIDNFFRGNYKKYYKLYIPDIKPGKDDSLKTWCPFHKGNSMALSINTRTGLYKCHSCGAEGDIFTFYAKQKGLNLKSDFSKILAGIATDFKISNGNGTGVTPVEQGKKTAKSTIIAKYNYCDEADNVIFQKLRYEPKTFTIRRPDEKGGWINNQKGVTAIPYRLKGIRTAEEVIITEGEKDCDNLHMAGLTATCSPHGSSTWPSHFGEIFKGKNVILIPDNDAPGRKHMKIVAENLKEHALSIKWLDLPNPSFEGYDVSDFLDSFEDKEAAVERLSFIIESLKEYQKEAIEEENPILLTCASDITPEPVDWLWKGWIAKGKVHLSAGKPGSGKTTTALDLAATMSKGGLWPDGTRAPIGDVIIWSGEDDPVDTLIPRLIAMGADLSRIHLLAGVRDEKSTRNFDASRDMIHLRAAAKSKNIAMLIIDPIIQMVKGDSHKNAEVRRALQPLADLAHDLSCAVYGITHFNKGSSGQDPLERLTGSVAFGAVVRIAFASTKYEDEDEEKSRLFARIKNNIGIDGGGFKYQLELKTLEKYPDIEVIRIVWGEAVSGSARDLIDEAEGETDEKSKTDQACDWLQVKLTDGPVRSDIIMKDGVAVGFSRATLRRAKERVADSSKAGFGNDGHWVWTLRC